MAINGWEDNSEELGVHNRIYTICSFSACLYFACTVHTFIFPNFGSTFTSVNKTVLLISTLWRASQEMQPYSSSEADCALHTMTYISGPVLPIQITAQIQ